MGAATEAVYHEGDTVLSTTQRKEETEFVKLQTNFEVGSGMALFAMNQVYAKVKSELKR